LKRSDLQFSLWLPFFSLWSWLIFVATPIGLLYLQLVGSAGLSGRGKIGDLVVPRDRFLPMAVHFGCFANASLVKALGVPGMFGELALSLGLSWPDSWHPAPLLLDDWRVLAFPFFSLPFWWFAGRGWDGLFRVRRLRWYSLLPGTLFSIMFLVLGVGLFFTNLENPKFEQAEIVWAFWGLGLWSFLLAAYPASWIRNRKFKAVA